MLNIDIDAFRDTVYAYLCASVIQNNPSKASDVTDRILAALVLCSKK